jgi:hypothetical protein
VTPVAALQTARISRSQARLRAFIRRAELPRARAKVRDAPQFGPAWASVLDKDSERGTTSAWPDHTRRRAGRGRQLNLAAYPFLLRSRFRCPRSRNAKAKRAWGRSLPTRWNFRANGVSRVACPCPAYLAPSQDAPRITLSSLKLQYPKNRCLGTIPPSSMTGGQIGKTRTPRSSGTIRHCRGRHERVDRWIARFDRPAQPGSRVGLDPRARSSMIERSPSRLEDGHGNTS